MKPNRMKDALERIARRAVPEDLNLMPNIAARLERKSLMTTLRARPIMTLLLVLLSLIVLTGVAYAIGKFAGYIPGVGLVDQSLPLRILREDAALKRDGLSVSVYQVVASAEYTYVAYAVDGMIMPAQGSPFCGVYPYLKLPDGSTLEILSGGSGGFGGEVGMPVRFETTVYYPPIPADVNQVTFVLDCVFKEDAELDKWQLPLELIPAPEGFATPGVEVDATFVATGPEFNVPPTATPIFDGTPFVYDPSFPATPTPARSGSGLYLEQVIELPNSFILTGNFKDAGDLPGALLDTGSVYDYLPKMQDRNGNPVPFTPRDDIKPIVNWAGVHYWAYEIPKSVEWPLTITLDEINIAKFYAADFQFDAGVNPKPGQKWDLGFSIQLGNYEYVMDSVEAVENGYLFRYHSGKDVPEGVSPMFNIIGHTPEQNQGVLINKENVVEYSEKLIFSPPLPTGLLTVEMSNMEEVPLQGPWTLTWSPPGQ